MFPELFASADTHRRWEFLLNLPPSYRQGDALFVHGSPRDPTNEYLLPFELEWGPTEKYEQVFAAFQRVLFVGHSHMPGVITDRLESWPALDSGSVYLSAPGDGRKLIVNVGSVGQPRDRDPRACYVIVDGDRIGWRRVPYDHERTMAKIRQIDALDDALAMRLARGI